MARREGPDLGSLPGGELVARGLADLAAGRHSAEALCVAQGASRLRFGGFRLPDELPADPDLALYDLLCRSVDDPYGHYNALRRELVSFLDAWESLAGPAHDPPPSVSASPAR